MFQLKVVQQEVFQTPLLICQPASTLKCRLYPPELQRKTSSMIRLKICTPDLIHQCLKPAWMLQVMRHTLHSCISWHPFTRDMRWTDYTWRWTDYTWKSQSSYQRPALSTVDAQGDENAVQLDDPPSPLPTPSLATVPGIPSLNSQGTFDYCSFVASYMNSCLTSFF